jgi:hypothetical protein
MPIKNFIFFANSFFDFSKLDIYKCPKMTYGIENEK